MKKFRKYDPEDIESLLLNKEFSELYDEERVFVLKHISSEREYNSLRKTLLNITGAVVQETDPFIPSPQVKRNLLEEVKRNAPARIPWLNSITALFDLRIPAVRYSLTAVVLIAAGLVIMLNMNDQKTDAPVAEAVKTGKAKQVIGADTSAPLKEVSPQQASKQQLVKKEDNISNDIKNDPPSPPLPAVASRSLAHDEALEGFLYEVM